MKFFIDTANLEQIREAYALGVLDGVTTNPSLMAKEGIKGTENQRKHYVEICNIVGGDVSAEVIATDYEGMIREGEELAALNPHIVVKVPCIADGIKAIKYFTEKGIRTNCTLVFSAGQALLAAKAGATYVSPFVGRLDDICEDGVGLVADIDYSRTDRTNWEPLIHIDIGKRAISRIVFGQSRFYRRIMDKIHPYFVHKYFKFIDFRRSCHSGHKRHHQQHNQPHAMKYGSHTVRFLRVIITVSKVGDFS